MTGLIKKYFFFLGLISFIIDYIEDRWTVVHFMKVRFIIGKRAIWKWEARIESVIITICSYDINEKMVKETFIHLMVTSLETFCMTEHLYLWPIWNDNNFSLWKLWCHL